MTTNCGLDDARKGGSEKDLTVPPAPMVPPALKEDRLIS